MKFKEYKSPSPYILIDDFLTTEEYNSVMFEVNELRSKMHAGKYLTDDKEVDYPEIKSNLNIWLDTEFKDRRNLSSILNIFINKIWNDEMKKITTNTDSGIFRTYIHTKSDNTLLSAYTDGSFYNTHKDIAPGMYITTNLMLGEGFKGGDFKLGNKVIPFKKNRLIMFESHKEHSVTKVQTDDNPDNWRYSIQYFAKL
jgi:Rps23 Pro-64 3,4-dihydroxylase Tpa1-like proline 4-hydroxylase